MKIHKGYTLIEILVALSLSTIMLTMIFSVITNSTKSYYSFIDKYHQINTIQIAQKILKKQVNNTGVFNSNQKIEHIFLGNCQPNPSCTFDGNDSDQIALLQTLASGKDCIGNSVNTRQLYATIISVAKNSNGRHSLYCQSYNISTRSYTGYKQPIIDDVLDMQIAYHQQLANNNIIVNNASNVGSWDNIRGVTFSLIITSNQRNQYYNLGTTKSLYRLENTPIEQSSFDNAITTEFYFTFHNSN